MTLEYGKICTIFGKCAQLEVLTHMLNKKQDYLSGIAEATGLSHSSVSRVITPMVDAGLFTESRLGKQIRMFTLNEEAPIIQEVVHCFDLIGKSIEIEGAQEAAPAEEVTNENTEQEAAKSEKKTPQW